MRLAISAAAVGIGGLAAMTAIVSGDWALFMVAFFLFTVGLIEGQ